MRRQPAGSSVGLQKIRGLDIVEGLAPSETEKELTRSFRVRRARNVGAPATLGNSAPTILIKEEKLWMIVIHLYLLAP
jgi:hypothetical protein